MPINYYGSCANASTPVSTCIYYRQRERVEPQGYERGWLTRMFGAIFKSDLAEVQLEKTLGRSVPPCASRVTAREFAAKLLTWSDWRWKLKTWTQALACDVA